MHYINPADYGVVEDCRLVLKNDITDEIILLEYIGEGDKYLISDQNIKENIFDYKFLFQTKINQGFRNLTSYNYFFDSQEIQKYFLNQIQVSDEDAYNILSVYWKSNSKVNIMKPVVRKTLEFIWKNKGNRTENLKQMIRLSKRFSEEISLLWNNIISFMYNLITLYSQLTKSQLLKKEDYLTFNESNQTSFRMFLEGEINRLADSDLQIEKFMAANYYSYLGDRENASKYYTDSKNMFQNLDVITLLNIESNGISTYKNLDSDKLDYNRNEIFPSFRFYSDELPSNTETTVIFSMDKKFLKAYGIQLLYAASILKKVHFHYHIIDDDAEEIVKDTHSMFMNIVRYREIEDEIIPTFSYESLSDKIVNKATYYACARFMHADYFLEKFDNDILILDADFYIIDELDDLFKKCRQHDIATSVSSMGLSVFPWRRFMAGMVFLSNTEYSKEYSRVVTAYILDQIKNKKTWTLDQNALTYGYEKITNKYPEINFGNLAIKQPPIMHPRFRGLVEKG